MKTEIVLRNENLWQRIQEFSLDAQNASFPFSKKLAKEENWSSEFTQRAIEEYKKFVYLCCISPNGASPSEIVDKVWHMHLIYTQNYWEDFCPNVLKMNLHHHPSNGGIEEKYKLRNWFSETLENYKEIFQQEAPDEIWKCQNKKSSFWNFGFKFLLLLLAFFLLNSCSNETGSAMITIGIIAVIVFFVFGIAGALFGENNSTDLEKKNKNDGNSDSGSCGGGGSSCSGGSSCGSGCGGGCGGCGGS